MLGNYLTYQASRISASASAPNGGTDYWSTTKTKHERPLGYTPDQAPYPFMTKQHASIPIDGKRKAQMNEEIIVSMIDLEQGLKYLTDEYLSLIYKHYLFQTHTIQDLCNEQGVTSRGSMRNKCYRALCALTRYMNNGGPRERKR